MSKCLIASLALLLIHSSSGQQCSTLSFQRLCVTDGANVVLENEKLSMTINKTRGQISALYYNSRVDPGIRSTNLLRGGSGYYLANVVVDGSSLAVEPVMGNMEITQNVSVATKM
ncbi:uncharacterized protein LOC108738715 [Agrilus planipennis]|uniref:Uncharacterized protein LOC108738715 n=1 Tax=Agrilus planipennis TaxID=224129 RepID=A0A1W4X5U0_AGRPL|nr:uncharacterized protein LOC108738715 [Agrilus planipennis]